jgi:hypothetical protein
MKFTRTTLLTALLGVAAVTVFAAQTITVTEDTAWRMYNEQRATKVMFRNRLVERDSLTPLTGFVLQNTARLSDGSRSLRGGMIELAKYIGDTNVAMAMSLRPNLWKRTGERVFLQDYEPMEGAGMLTRVYGSEMRRIGSVRVYQIAKEPSYEDWKRLVSGQK